MEIKKKVIVYRHVWYTLYILRVNDYKKLANLKGKLLYVMSYIPWNF